MYQLVKDNRVDPFKKYIEAINSSQKENIKAVKRNSTSLVIREMEIKTTRVFGGEGGLSAKS